MLYRVKGHGRTRATLMPKPSSYDLVLPAVMTTSMTVKAGMKAVSAGKTPALAPPFFSSYM
jgi:hypothetical protein